jgi:excisionase family DNA binding protein
MNMKPGQFHTVEQVAEKIGISVDTVRRAIKSGRLECCRIGYRTIRVSESQLTKYLNESIGAKP